MPTSSGSIRRAAERVWGSAVPVGTRHRRSASAKRARPCRFPRTVEPVLASAGATPVFDAYWMIDWSACSKPATGSDSIWAALAKWEQGKVVLEEPRNTPVRCQFIEELLTVLTGRLRDARVLVGVDFPLGYPRGFAQALGWTRSASVAPWRFVWERLRRDVCDGPRNENNRFEVAAALNDAVSGSVGPFFGRPRGASDSVAAHLPTAQRGHFEYPLVTRAGSRVARSRCTDERAGTASSPWFLFGGSNSVGGQALVGIPHLARVREAVQDSRVWPFETGPQLPAPDVRVVLAEIYPTMFELGGATEEARDRRQVAAAALGFARLDASGQFDRLLGAPRKFGPALEEEGWVLGAE